MGVKFLSPLGGNAQTGNDVEGCALFNIYHLSPQKYRTFRTYSTKSVLALVSGSTALNRWLLYRHSAVAARKADSVGNASPITRSKERRSELFFASKATKKCHIYISGKARLSPSQERDSSDDAEPPTPLVEESLKIARRLKQRRHLRRFADRTRANHACCSTRPEDVRGGEALASSPVPKSCRIASCVSADSISRRRISSSSSPARRHVSTHRRRRSRSSLACRFDIPNLIVTERETRPATETHRRHDRRHLRYKRSENAYVRPIAGRTVQRGYRSGGARSCADASALRRQDSSYGTPSGRWRYAGAGGLHHRGGALPG